MSYGVVGSRYNRLPLTEIQHDFQTKCGSSATANGLNSGAIANNERFKQATLCNTDEKLVANTDKGFANGFFDGPKGVFGHKGTLANPMSNPNGSPVPGYSAVTPIVHNNNDVRYQYQWTRINEAGITQTWIVTAVDKNRLKGDALAIALGIPTNSIAIVDTDNGIIKKRFKVGPPTETAYTLYYCINNVTRADSAGKANENDVHLFSGFNGIICKALISTNPIEVHANNELKMNYKVQNKWDGAHVSQKWQKVHGNTDSPEFEVKNAHSENNISFRSAQIKSAMGKSASISGPFEKGDQAKQNAIIQATLAKRSGDYFQGWITKYLLKNIDDCKTKYYTKSGARYVENSEPVNIQAMHAAARVGDIFTSTGDFPYLCFCIECLGVSVLFKDGQDIVYVRRIEP
jgi:hypothetical protein